MEKLKVLNPRNNQEIAQLDITTKKDLSKIVEKSRESQRKWSQKSPQERGDLLKKSIPLFKEKSKKLAKILAEEMGKPVAEAQAEISALFSMDKLIDEMVVAFTDEIKEDAATASIVQHRALGVSAVISPWNFPLAMPHSMVLPSLMAGNSVVLKPSEETPLIALEYVKILNEVLPEGVLSAVIGRGDVGAMLVASGVDLVVFTGSVATGKKILSEASKSLTRVILELGGKDPLLVLKGADLSKAAKMAVFNSLRNCGQVCVSTEKILVLKEDKEEFEKLVLKEMEALSLDRNNFPDVGPMIHQGQKNLVVDQVEDAKNKGAKVLFYKEDFSKDNYLSPIVLTDVKKDMKVYQEETFGPIVSIIEVKDENEMIKVANDSEFGLGCIIMGDENQALEVAKKIEAGMIGINQRCNGAFGTPWVGVKNSGYGFHKSIEGHRQFTQVRVISKGK